MSKFGNIEVITGSCNVSTVKDGRGALFSWVPKEPILEFNLVLYTQGKIRGNHCHPEFNEYILIVDGTFSLLTKHPETDEEMAMIASKGSCFYIPQGVPHALVASSNSTLVSFLTKPWEECEQPILREELVPQDIDYSNYAKKQGFVHSAEEIRKKKES